jgi:ABC-type proline/glycine betaine transport system permease subunit
MRHPTYSNGKVAFSYLGDLWVANENGAGVQRLAQVLHRLHVQGPPVIGLPGVAHRGATLQPRTPFLKIKAGIGRYNGRRINQRGLFIEPPLMALYTAPRLVLLPILIVWLGIGMVSKVAVVFLGAVFPIIINTIAGIRDADLRLIQAARAFGASQLDIYVKVLIPGSLPAILMGIRLGIGRGLLSVIVGEMFVSEAGIGYQLMSYGQGMQIDKMLVYAFVVSIFGYALTVSVQLIESHIRSWRPNR